MNRKITKAERDEIIELLQLNTRPITTSGMIDAILEAVDTVAGVDLLPVDEAFK